MILPAHEWSLARLEVRGTLCRIGFGELDQRILSSDSGQTSSEVVG